MKQEFNEKDYKREYNKLHYKSKKIYLKPEEEQKMNEVLSKRKISIREFLNEKIEEELKMKFYVKVGYENFKRTGDGSYKYNQCFDDVKGLNKNFETEEEAIKYAESLNMPYELNRDSLDIFTTDIYKDYDENTNCDPIYNTYSNNISPDEIASKENITIIY